MASDSVFMARRDKSPRDKAGIKREEFIKKMPNILADIQSNLFNRALAFRKDNTLEIDDRKAFDDIFTSEENKIHGGFVYSHWCGSDKCEARIKEELSVTIRCIPFEASVEQGRCICCGEASSQRVLFAKAY